MGMMGMQIWGFRQWRAAVVNELLQLTRDRTGLILLFLMPAVLVLIITMVEDPLLKQEGGGFRIKGLVVDQDGGEAARTIIQSLVDTAAVTVSDRIKDVPVDLQQARDAVNNGRYQFYLAIPQEMSEAMDRRLEKEVDAILSGKKLDAATLPPLPDVTLCFDPAIRSSYRAAISGAAQSAVATMETTYGLTHMGRALNRQMGAMGGMGATPAPTLKLDRLMDQRTVIAKTTAGPDPFADLPTSVQQNVPAWALFGMFFIVVPLSTSLIRERREGIIDRLKTMPVSLVILVLGKLTAFVCVCMVQFVCIFLVGKWLLPLLGTDTLVLGDKLPAVALVAICSSLAATGYGILLGSLARTHEQATVIGPVSVVIAAAIGGVMVPIFAMPTVMQTLGQVSPLAWAHSAFMTLLVRNGALTDVILPSLVPLLLFFFITALIGGIALSRRQ